MHRGLVVCSVVLSLWGCHAEPGSPSGAGEAARNSGLRFLQGDAEQGFARATEPRAFEFPADHGTHNEYRAEWWYLTGNVEGPGGRRLGFQLTFFRFALGGSPEVQNRSAWRTGQTWMAHLAIVDEAGRRFVARERVAREALGLAGATTAPLRVWVEDWSLLGPAAGDGFSLTVDAGDSSVGLELRIAGGEVPVLQGDGGLDRKGPEEGNASYYYSVPGLGVTGTVRLDGAAIPVEGMAWLDREWGTSALSGGIVGWDWFALQFEQGGSLMYYRLREGDGSPSAYSGGTLITRDGRRIRLGANDVLLEPKGFWVSERTLRRYPIDWQIDIPTRDLELTVKAWLPNQELDLSVRYWEGAVDADGYESDVPLKGRGYVELTGY